jgi:hypothetical protein
MIKILTVYNKCTTPRHNRVGSMHWAPLYCASVVHCECKNYFLKFNCDQLQVNSNYKRHIIFLKDF